MSEGYKIRSLSEIVNEILSTVRSYYDAEYAYYIEKDRGDIETIYEWCDENIEWQRDRMKLLPEERQPKWMKTEITDTTARDYSVFLPISEDVTAVLAVVGVRRGGCTIDLMRAIVQYIPQAIALQKMQKQQEYLSYHDDLTGLLNRNSLVHYFDTVDEKKLKSIGALSVDINGLKNFNKEFGRDYGDEVVIRVGEVLEEYFHSGEAYRLTGDEYLVLVENTSYQDFTKQVHAVHTKLDNISLGLVSIGYAWEKIDIEVDKLVNNAEVMMREEKRKYYKNLQKGHHEPIIKEDLLQDIENGNFIVCLVPKIDTLTGEVGGAEAVVRYHHKDLGIVDPGRYLNMLEETKLSHYLDLYVFEEVCKTLHKWEVRDIPMIPVSVNFAGATLRQEGLADKMHLLSVLPELLERLGKMEPNMQSDRKANPFLEHLQEEILLSTTRVDNICGLYTSYSLSSSSDCLKMEPFIISLSENKEYIRIGRLNAYGEAQWGMGVTGDPQNFYCMFSENPSPQFTLVTIYLQIPFFRNPRQLRGLYIGLDYNRNPVARRILLIKKSDCTDTEEFLSMESGLIQKEDFTSEQQAYYDYTC